MTDFKIKKTNPILDDLEASINELPVTTNLAPPDLSLGCDMLDLYVSGQIGKAVSPGMFVWLHGPSGSGKSFHAKTVMAEAANSEIYQDHRFVVIDGENGSNFDTAKFFGRKLALKLETIEVSTLDHLYDKLDEITASPCVVIVDSWDSWLPHGAIEKIEIDRKRRAEGKAAEGDYNMAHGKIHSNRLRLLVPKLAKTNSILLGISQHRDNIDRNNKYSPKDVVPGGRALKFWSHVEIETKLVGKIEKEIQGSKIPIGDIIQVKILKNRVNGLKLSITEEFYPTLGIDNLATSLNWLVENRYVTVAGGRYSLPILGDKKLYREAVIQKIEDENLEDRLRDFLSACYNDYMSQMQVKRKGRYD